MPVSPMAQVSFEWRFMREGLKEVFWNSIKSVDSKLGLAFAVATSNRSYEELYSLAGLTNFGVWADGTAINYEAVESRYLSKLTHITYAKGLRYTRDLKTDEKYGLMKQAVSEMALAAANTREGHASAFFNNGFTTVWNSTEGQYFFDDDHPMSSRSSTSTDSNLVTGALSLTTLESAIIAMRDTLDDVGRKMNIRPIRLWVPSALEFTAKKILQSPDDPSTANRSVNPVHNLGLQLVVWPNLSSTTAWMLQGDYAKTLWYDRVPLNEAMEEDFDTGDTKHKAAYRSSVGAADWRGWVGSLGT